MRKKQVWIQTDARSAAHTIAGSRPVSLQPSFTSRDFCTSPVFLQREDPIVHLLPWKTLAKNAFALCKVAKTVEEN